MQSRPTAHRLATVTLACAVLAACTGSPTPQTRATSTDVDWVEATLGRMTLEQKVGQVFMVVAYGTDATRPAARDAAENRDAFGVDTPAQVVEKYAPGGLVYFTWSHNLDEPRQIAALTNGVQRASAVPLLIGIDQEQGTVRRIGRPLTQLPGGMALGATRSAADAERAAAITGNELRALGVNTNYAPVADVNVNAANPVIGVRSFADDPALVGDLVAAQVRGLQGAGVVATAKHFPGHGDTNVDSHTALPVITHSLAEWERVDAPPFRAAIAAGTDMIMTAHIVVRSLDPSGDPATLSHPILTGMLRERLGFNGVVVTDSLSMEGVRTKYGDERVPVLALKAGADMLLMPPRMDVAYRSVLAAVRSGELPQTRLDASVRRILALKQRRGLTHAPRVDANRVGTLVGTKEHLAAGQEIFDRAVTVVSNKARLLPLDRAARSVLVTGWDSETTRPVGELAEQLAARGGRATALATGGEPGTAATATAVAAARRHDLTVVLTRNAGAEQRRFVRALVATGRPVVVVAVQDPYDIAHVAPVGTSLVTYSHQPEMIRSLVRVLYGETKPRGRLPVRIPTAGGATLYPFGHGLSW